MNYFTAGLYSDYNAYKLMKGLLKEGDKLWILGDVLDGNNEHPELGLKILDDIMSSENVTLVLGDHEYFHAMRLFSETESEDEEDAEIWASELANFEYSGNALIEYMNENLTAVEREEYANFLASLDVSEVVPIDGRLFYLCHGAPARMEDKESQWQYNVVIGNIDFYKNYGREMTSDIRVPYFAKTFGIRRQDLENAIIIEGHAFIPNLENEGEDVEDGIVVNNRIMCINSGASGESNMPHIVVGIDSAGWQTFEIGG